MIAWWDSLDAVSPSDPRPTEDFAAEMDKRVDALRGELEPPVSAAGEEDRWDASVDQIHRELSGEVPPPIPEQDVEGLVLRVRSFFGPSSEDDGEEPSEFDTGWNRACNEILDALRARQQGGGA